MIGSTPASSPSCYVAGLLSVVSDGGTGVRTLRELARSYLTITKDLTRVRNRIKGLYRSWAIPCSGQKVYSPRYRSAWLKKLTEAGVRRRAEWLYQQLDGLQPLRRQARRELLAESRKHPAEMVLRGGPLARPDSGCPPDRLDPDTAPFSDQTAALGL